MPNIKSVIKDVKKSRERRLRNLAAKSRIKTFIKKTRTAMATDLLAAETLLSETVSIVDKAAKHGIIHKNAAARKKSRLMKKMNLAKSAS